MAPKNVLGFTCNSRNSNHPRTLDPFECPHPRKEPFISANHLITPIIITGGAVITAIILMSQTKDPKANPSSVSKFINDNITTKFVAAIPEITPELNLELAMATQTEVLTKTDSSRMTPNAFCRHFKQQTHRTFTDVINEMRIREACRLLCETKASVTEIGYACGFGNLAHFHFEFGKRK